MKPAISDSLEENSLYYFANARSLAFFGASNRGETMGSIIFMSLMESGYRGDIYPVHPKEQSIRGLPAYPSADNLPLVPDLAVLVLPTKVVPEVLEACGRKGIRQVIIVSGGFKEIGGEGIALEEDLKRIIHKYGIRVVGPNCLGIVNTRHRINTTPMLLRSEPGSVGLVSQSGSFVAQMFEYLSHLGLAFSTAFSVGNEMDVDLVDCMEYLEVCPDTKVIALYIEGIKRGREFLQAAQRISCKKPVVAFYVGGSETGKKAAFSHTGAMSGPDELYTGMFRQCGILRAYSVTELFDYCWALARLPEPGGRGVVIQTHSGGPGASAADVCGRSGLELPALTEGTRKALAEHLPHTASMGNPVDSTFTQDPRSFFFDIPRIILEDENLDFLLIYLFLPEDAIKQRLIVAGFSEEDTEKMIADIIRSGSDAFIKVLEKTKKPVIGFTYLSIREAFIKKMIQTGMPVFQDPARAVAAIGAVVDYYEFKNRMLREA